jgi:hypothetical protein
MDAVPAPKRRKRQWVAFAAAAVLSACGSSYLDTTESDNSAWFSDNMDRGDGPFVAESDPNVTLAYEDGGYVMALNARPSPNLQTARYLHPETTNALRVGATFGLRDQSSEWMVGVGCVAGGNYYLYLTNFGEVFVAVEDLVAETKDLLADTQIDDRSTGRLTLECRGGQGGEPTELVGFVDDEEVVTALHPNGWDSFKGMAVTAATPPDQSVDVLWDDAFAQEL